ncbi:HyaD/HybD family hydrogenase maturation endopeptidase [candidate division KSB1 bacterium]|nr:HyaD/HybD family hydrogenase maturation endopeptidase [candidate division KSB1 bacterium]
MASTPVIKIMGVGNILLGDDGFGIQVVEKLQNEFQIDPPIEIIDGGTRGMYLLSYLDDCDIIYIVDCANMGNAPGTLYKFTFDGLPFDVPYKTSVHQIGLFETLTASFITGNSFKAIILAVEPKHFESVRESLSPEVEDKIDKIIDILKNELNQHQISLTRKG